MAFLLNRAAARYSCVYRNSTTGFVCSAVNSGGACPQGKGADRHRRIEPLHTIGDSDGQQIGRSDAAPLLRDTPRETLCRPIKA